MKKVLLILFLFLALSPVAYGEEEFNDDFRNAVELEDSLLSPQTDLREPSGISEDTGFGSIVSYYLRQIAAAQDGVLQMFAYGVAITLFSALIGRFSDNLQNRKVRMIFSFIVSLSVAMMCGGKLQQAAKDLKSGLESMRVFTAACVPSFTAVMIAAGESAGASAFSAMMVVLGEISTLIAEAALLPLTDVYLALGICVSVSDDFNFSSLVKRIKKIITGAIGIAVGAFHLIGKLRISAANAGDTVLKKYIRTAVGSMIPVVGGNLAEGIDGLFAAATGAKISFAIAGVLIVLSVTSPVLIRAGLYGLCWSGCGWLADFLNEPAVSKLFKVIADGYYMILILGCGITFMGMLSFFGLIAK